MAGLLAVLVREGFARRRKELPGCGRVEGGEMGGEMGVA
jgi:hypothetical protein